MKNYVFKSVYGTDIKVLSPVNAVSELKLGDVVYINGLSYKIICIY